MNMIKKIMYCSVIITAVFAPVLQCQSMRNIAIILDPHNVENPGQTIVAMTQDIIIALTEKRYPFTVSPSLWHNYVTRKERFKDSSDHQNLKTALAAKNTAAINKIIENNTDFTCFATPFNPDEWICKKIPNVAYIFVPKAYLESIKKNSQEIINTIPMISKELTLFRDYLHIHLTVNELLLGLKIEHFLDIGNPLASVPANDMNNQLAETENFDWTQLFVTRQDLGLMSPTPAGTKKNLPQMTKEQWQKLSETEQTNRIKLSTKEKQRIDNYTQYQSQLLKEYIEKNPADAQATADVFEQYLFPWCIFFAGHGTYDTANKEGFIASLPVKSFLKFVRFCNFYIKTRFLLYETCYGGGQHSDPTFSYKYRTATRTLWKSIPYDLNFVVASGALTDQIARNKPELSYVLLSQNSGKMDPTKIVTIDNTQFILETNMSFAAFFTDLEKYFTTYLDKSTIKQPQKTLANIIEHISSFKEDIILEVPAHLQHLISSAVIANTSSTPIIRSGHAEKFKAVGLDDTKIIDKKTIVQYLSNPQKSFVVNEKTLLIYEIYTPLYIVAKVGTRIVPMNTARPETMNFIKEITFEERMEQGKPVAHDLLDAFSSFVPFPDPAPYKKQFFIETLNMRLHNNQDIPGPLGEPRYKNQKISLHDVRITQLQDDVAVDFRFDTGGKSYYYQSRFSNKELFIGAKKKQFLDYLKLTASSPNDMLYEDNFNHILAEFKQYVRDIETVQQQKLKRGPRPFNWSERIKVPIKKLIQGAYNGSKSDLNTYFTPESNPNIYLSAYEHGIQDQLIPLSPLTAAIMNRQNQTVSMLLDAPIVDPNYHNNSLQLSPLHYAALAGNTQAAEALLGRKADINAQNIDGDTPLHIANRLGASDLVTLLLAKGANPSLKNKKGEVAKLQPTESKTSLLESLQALSDSLRGLAAKIR